MKNLDKIAAELFNKIRGRFPNVTIGDADGNITNVPDDSRFYNFSYKVNGEDLGKVSVSLDEENGVVVIVGKDLVQNQNNEVQNKWFNFLKELRLFAKKRLLSFDVRDINKNNLTKRDFSFLATNRSGENPMAESKMYGTSKTSYQRIGNARLAIKHSQPINTESISGRTQKIHSIYIESPSGERFKYPFKHLSGARAMARHVSEGGNAYDDFGKYISGLSEEISKLRKFSQYVGRSSVMAETLIGYSDIVKTRISEVKKEIQHLQKESFYKEAIANFIAPVVEDVPEDVAENWIDQLTIKQFNEELKDVFPYIYKLVGEAKKAETVTFEDLVAEANDPCWKNYNQIGMKKKGNRKVPNCVPEEIQLEAGIEQMMGQFSEEEIGYGNLYIKFREKQTVGAGPEGKQSYLSAFAGFEQNPKELKDVTALRRFTSLNSKMDIANMVKKLMNDKTFVSAKKIILYRDNPGLEQKFPYLEDFYNWIGDGVKGKVRIEIETPVEDPDEVEKDRGAGKKRLPKGYFAANPKDYKIPDKKMTRYFTLGNTRLFNYLRREKPQLMQQYFRPNFGGFVMNDAAFRSFLKLTKSGELFDQFGDPQIEVDQNKSFAEEFNVGEGPDDNFTPDDLVKLQRMGDINAIKQRALELITTKSKRPMRPEKVMWFKKAIASKRTAMDVVKLMYDLMLSGEGHGVVGTSSSMKQNSYRDKFKDNIENNPEEKKTPIGEFILSYYDKETGKFPKGETAVLTAVQKEYGDHYVKPAAHFVKKLESITMARKAEEIQQSAHPETEMIKQLAGM